MYEISFKSIYSNSLYINFKDDKINEIVKNTLQLKKIYNEDLIIDHINSKKDLKKIRQELFFISFIIKHILNS